MANVPQQRAGLFRELFQAAGKFSRKEGIVVMLTAREFAEEAWKNQYQCWVALLARTAYSNACFPLGGHILLALYYPGLSNVAQGVPNTPAILGHFKGNQGMHNSTFRVFHMMGQARENSCLRNASAAVYSSNGRVESYRNVYGGTDIKSDIQSRAVLSIERWISYMDYNRIISTNQLIISLPAIQAIRNHCERLVDLRINIAVSLVGAALHGWHDNCCTWAVNVLAQYGVNTDAAFNAAARFSPREAVRVGFIY